MFPNRWRIINRCEEQYDPEGEIMGSIRHKSYPKKVAIEDLTHESARDI